MPIPEYDQGKTCCFVCKKKDTCINPCGFYVMARKYHKPETIGSAKCTSKKDLDRCLKCEIGFEAETA